MSASRPKWVIDELVKLLGLDEESIRQQLLPDLEGYTSETRLRSHLQDFLGPGGKASTFTSRYANLRFPSIQPASIPTRERPSIKSDNALPSISPVPHLSSTSGSTGQICKKNREADDLAGWGGISKMAESSLRPTQIRHPQPMRAGGAVTIHEVKSNSPKVHDDGLTSRTASGKGKQREKIWDAPKSKQILRLEGIRENLGALQTGRTVDALKELPNCFCRARVHKLAEYTPQCGHCGLILCELHPTHAPCPSCLLPLLSPAQIARLLQRIEADVQVQLALEQGQRDEEERQRSARIIAESGGGSFPVLPGQRASPVPHQSQPRKVITIGKASGNGRAQVTSTTYTRAVPSSAPARTVTPPPSDIVGRPRSPAIDRTKRLKELDKVQRWREEEDRPWGDLKAEKKGDSWLYIPDEVPLFIDESSVGRRKESRRKKGEVKLGEGGRVVPGAGIAA